METRTPCWQTSGPRRAPRILKERSEVRIVRSGVDVKQWLLEGPPSVSVARPPHCPGCGAASRPVGACLVLHGHGLRARTVIVWVGGRSKLTEILARRYVCRACDAVALVMPGDVARRCLYTLSVIAAALAHWSHRGWSAETTRAAFGAFPVLGAAAEGWPSLVRWSHMAERLWPRLGPLPDASPRALAHRVSAKLSAFAPVPLGPVLTDCVAGAVHAC